MDTRKEYVRPAVESEEILEQTALQCTNSLDFRGTIPDPCEFKHHAFYGDWVGFLLCQIWPLLQNEAQCGRYRVPFS